MGQWVCLLGGEGSTLPPLPPILGVPPPWWCLLCWIAEARRMDGVGGGQCWRLGEADGGVEGGWMEQPG